MEAVQHIINSKIYTMKGDQIIDIKPTCMNNTLTNIKLFIKYNDEQKKDALFSLH